MSNSNTISTPRKASKILANGGLIFDRKESIKHTPDFLILEGLIKGARDITALNGFKYSSTRISNYIVELRKKGLVIYTENIKTPNNKHYGIYLLDRAKPNIQKAQNLLNQVLNGLKILSKTSTN